MLTCGFSDGGGNRSARRKPPRTGEEPLTSPHVKCNFALAGTRTVAGWLIAVKDRRLIRSATPPPLSILQMWPPCRNSSAFPVRLPSVWSRERAARTRHREIYWRVPPFPGDTTRRRSGWSFQAASNRDPNVPLLFHRQYKTLQPRHKVCVRHVVPAFIIFIIITLEALREKNTRAQTTGDNTREH